MDVRKQPPILGIIVPCFNEAETIEKTAIKLCEVMEGSAARGDIDRESFILFVDDGSNDVTWDIIKRLHEKNRPLKGLRLTRNEGHQAAILAGMLAVRGKVGCAITIDADLQQDETRIPEFIERYMKGADIVFGIRRDRSTDTFVKKFTALSFYKLMEWMGVPLIKNHADYRLISRRVIDVISEYGEVNIFLRGIFAGLGFKTDHLFFDVKERTEGTTKYTFRKMLSLAMDGITSFSIAPLRLVTLTGFAVFSASILMILFVLLSKFVPGMTVRGWSSTIISLYFLGGIQILALGIIGEYLGKIYQEIKKRPRFIIEEELSD